MSSLLAALGILAGGYLLTYLVFDRLRRKFGYVGGAEYVLLGAFLGPAGSGLLDPAAVRDLAPVASVALGWLGVLLGTRMRLRDWVDRPAEHLGVAMAEAGTTWVVAGGASWLLLHHLLGWTGTQAVLPSLTLAAIAVAGAPQAIEALASRSAGTHPLWPLVRTVSLVDAVFGVVAFGVATAALHLGTVQTGVRPPTATEWVAINVAVGLASGVLFHLFLGPAARGLEHQVEQADAGDARLFISLAGAIIIAAGAAYWLDLSPLFTTFLLGAVLGNSAQAHQRLEQLLARTAQPVYLVLLIFAGAAWSRAAGPIWFWFAFVAIRLLARLIGGRVGGTATADPALHSPWLGRALLTQGGLGAAIALDYAQNPGAPGSALVLAAALLSVLLFDWVGARETVVILGGRLSGEQRVVEPPALPEEGR
jgi:Kef-type K+ transport system membrane component KefB